MNKSVHYLFTGLIALCPLHLQALEVTGGLTHHQVLQCDDDGTADFALTGSAVTAGSLEAQVVGVQKTIVPWTPIGEGNTSWNATLNDVPVGGPYRVDLRIVVDGAPVEETSIFDVLVGDVWVLAGQSNMQGVGDRHDEDTPDPQVHTFSMSYEWRLAQEPLHTLPESPDPVHFDQNKSAEEREKEIVNWRDGTKGTGLGLPFAKEMLRRTGRPVGLIASAHGGTSMGQWNPELKDQGGASLYGSMLQQVAAAGGKVRGVLWYQGESDANPDATPIFPAGLRALIAAMRADFGNPDLPFYQVQIGRVVLGWNPNSWDAIQTAQLALETDVPHTGTVSAIDLETDDAIHISTPGLKTLGYRLANLAEADLFGGTTLVGPRYESMTRNGLQLYVKFSGVNDRLLAEGRPNGFSISAGPDGDAPQSIYKVEMDPNDPTVLILFTNNQLPENPHLWYGRGIDPYCNIVDEAQMGMPVFGPVPLP
tara:strand:+ start:101 stop:1540 length:1440 start_codon:yes stop_codon:yes gene_type:complete